MLKNVFKQCVINSNYETKLSSTAAKMEDGQLRKRDDKAKLSSSLSVVLILGDRTVSISDGTGERENE